MRLFRYKVSLTLKGPVLSKATSIAAFGLDAAMARDTQGRYYLPKNLVKGRLLQACAELREAAGDVFNFSVEKWLGEKSEDKGVAPNRGQIEFTDFIFEKGDADAERKTLQRINIDRDRGSVRRGALQIIEAPFAAGEEVCFDGKIKFMADEKEVEKIAENIKTGLRWIANFGGCRTIGFGRLLAVDIKEIPSENENESKGIKSDVLERAKNNRRLGIVIRPKGPFCFSKKRLNKYIFESDEVIPGGAIKAGVTAIWGSLLCKNDKDERFKVEKGVDEKREELCKYFEKLRFTNAFPSEKGTYKRPVVPPLSLVKAGGKCYDAALCENPVLIDGLAPSFSVDWKDHQDVKARFGWPEVRRDLRVRTAIDSALRRHKDNALFAYESVTPDSCEWLSHIDLSGVPDNELDAVIKQLHSLLVYGFIGWSKTKISADIEVISSEEIKPVVKKGESGKGKAFWVITLQTPAIICDPAKINRASGDCELKKAYEDAWADISKKAPLNLKWYFASQSLAGGYYLHRNFQEGNAYNPYLLTNAGSVFVLGASENAAEDDIEKLIGEWQRKGLTFPGWAKEAYERNGKKGDHWSNCPYIPENGYGEITVNLEHGFEMLKEGKR